MQSGKQDIAQQVTLVTPLPISHTEEAAKGAPEDIPGMIQRQVQALDFTLGSGTYNGGAIRDHFDALVPYSFFRYVIFLRPDRTFFGMVDARTLDALLRTPDSGWTYASFAEAVNAGDDARISLLPGFVPASDSVTDQTQKRAALELMERTGREWLPVIAADGKYRGVVDRAPLTASIVLDVTNRLSTSSPQN